MPCILGSATCGLTRHSMPSRGRFRASRAGGHRKSPSPIVRELMVGAGCTPGDADRVLVPAGAVRDRPGGVPAAVHSGSPRSHQRPCDRSRPRNRLCAQHGRDGHFARPFDWTARGRRPSPTRWVPHASCISWLTCIRLTRRYRRKTSPAQWYRSSRIWRWSAKPTSM